MTIPKWLEGSLSAEEISRIETSVKNAEKRTSAEIVPMIVHRSTLKATGARILFWISFGIIGVSGALGLALFGGMDEALLGRVIETLGIWPTNKTYLVLSIVAELLVVLISFAASWLIATWLSRFDFIHRSVFPGEDLTSETEHRAQVEFYSSELRSTSGRTGVLLLVSMLERRAVILADEAIASKLPPETWTEILSQLLGSIRGGKMGEGFAAAIDSMGQLLAPLYPPSKTDRNELSDRLRIQE